MSNPPSLGLAPKTVVVAPYDAEWPRLFQAEASRLAAELSAHGVALRLEHMGSTAVPGLAAKPIIDILAGRAPADDRARVIAALEAVGYTYRGEQGIPGRDFFRRGEPRAWHLHLAEVDGEFWRDHLAFRDHLRADPRAAAGYDALKRELAARFPRDRERYTEGKGEFVRDILRQARR